MTFVYHIETNTPPQPDSPVPVHTTSTIDRVLFDSLRGIGRETYQKLGGAEAFHQAERESWAE